MPRTVSQHRQKRFGVAQQGGVAKHPGHNQGAGSGEVRAISSGGARIKSGLSRPADYDNS